MDHVCIPVFLSKREFLSLLSKRVPVFLGTQEANLKMVPIGSVSIPG